MTREELDERLKNILGLDNWQYSTMPHEVEQLIRDCIAAVTPEEIEIHDPNQRIKIAEAGYNQAIENIEANTKELLG